MTLLLVASCCRRTCCVEAWDSIGDLVDVLDSVCEVGQSRRRAVHRNLQQNRVGIVQAGAGSAQSKQLPPGSGKGVRRWILSALVVTNHPFRYLQKRTQLQNAVNVGEIFEA
jgi:hypothetical protein